MARAREAAAGTCMGKARSGGSVPHVTRVLPRTGRRRPVKRYDRSRYLPHYALGCRRAHQGVEVVGEQRPREDGEPGPVDDLRQAHDELGAIPVITKEQTPLDAPHHHVVQGPGSIEARGARHGAISRRLGRGQ